MPSRDWQGRVPEVRLVTSDGVAYIDGREVRLGPMQMMVARLLELRHGHFVSNEVLENAVEKVKGEPPGIWAIRVTIHRLRGKGLPIETRQGYGYRLVKP